MAKSEVAKQSAGRVELALIPPSKFFMVVDLNNNFAQGPIESLDEAKYKAAEQAAVAVGAKPVGIFQFVGGVTKEQHPLYWQEAT